MEAKTCFQLGSKQHCDPWCGNIIDDGMHRSARNCVFDLKLTAFEPTVDLLLLVIHVTDAQVRADKLGMRKLRGVHPERHAKGKDVSFSNSFA